jgi:hypothetical protein
LNDATSSPGSPGALVGDFKNAGRTWQPKGEPVRVQVHDFPSMSFGKAVPYGIDDVAHNRGFVNVGTSHDTPDFAVESIRLGVEQEGRTRYPLADSLLVLADSGGSNSAHRRDDCYPAGHRNHLNPPRRPHRSASTPVHELPRRRHRRRPAGRRCLTQTPSPHVTILPSVTPLPGPPSATPALGSPSLVPATPMTPVSPTAQVTATPTSPGEAAFDLSAVVLDAGTGQFVAGATVDVLDASGRVVASFVTDGRGPAIVELPPGDYTRPSPIPVSRSADLAQRAYPSRGEVVVDASPGQSQVRGLGSYHTPFAVDDTRIPSRSQAASARSSSEPR